MIQLYRVCQVLHAVASQGTALHCIALHCKAEDYIALETECMALPYFTTDCTAPHDIALRCMVVLCTAASTSISVAAMLVLQYNR